MGADMMLSALDEKEKVRLHVFQSIAPIFQHDIFFPQELQLLDCNPSDHDCSSRRHELNTAPILTRDAYIASGCHEETSQYGVLGRVISVE